MILGAKALRLQDIAEARGAGEAATYAIYARTHISAGILNRPLPTYPFSFS